MSEGNMEESTRARIHRTAAELFARNGYHATGIAELSDAVQLGRGALYYHIGSKESLLFEISSGAINQLIPVAQGILLSNVTPTEKVHVLARELMRNIAELRAEWTVFFREFPALTGERRTQVMQARESYEAIWWKILDEGASTRDFIPVDSVVVKGLLGMFNYSYLWFNPTGDLTPDDIADRFSEVLLNGIKIHNA